MDFGSRQNDRLLVLDCLKAGFFYWVLASALASSTLSPDSFSALASCFALPPPSLGSYLLNPFSRARFYLENVYSRHDYRDIGGRVMHGRLQGS